MKYLIAGLALLLPVAAHAVTNGWEVSIPASRFMNDGGAFFGSASASVDARGNPVISFANSGDQFTTAEINIPAFLNSTTGFPINCTVYGEIDSTTTGNNACFNVAMMVSPTNNTASNWLTNDGSGTYSATEGIHPLGTANRVVSNTSALSFYPRDQTTGSNCASVAACASSPARLRVLRLTTGCASNDNAAFLMVKVVCKADTN